MPREFTRKDRVSDAMQRELAKLIREEVRDPRLALANITAVEVNRDLANAKVYVNFVGTDSEQENIDATEVLNGASGFLRSRIAKRMQMRTTPRLHFIYDHSGKRGQDLSALIERAVQTDKMRHDSSDSSSLDDVISSDLSPNSSSDKSLPDSSGED
ncbi:MAG: 30S ribosome-binding factor RbfA [Porticoccus sp.]|nr:30S ribosome-binding factor RbfA [Porticoccus sp.]